VSLFVRTVAGDIDVAQLGVCYAHEHVIIDPSFTTHLFPEFCIDSVDAACTELLAFHACGGRAMIDCMPCDSGRNALKLAEVSRRTGVHIVAPTGLHLQKYYTPGHWSTRLSAEELARLFIDDIEIGIDRNDYAGPEVDRTTIRAGVIKIAAGLGHLSDYEKKIFRAAAQAHVKTGCPVITHTDEGTAGIEQLDVLISNGVDPRHITLSHTDRKPDLEYHRALLRRGAGLEYDSAFRWKEGQGNPTLDLVCQLLPEFPSQIMLGMDAARGTYWSSYGGKPGLTFLLTTFKQSLLSRGLTDTQWEKIVVENPARYFSFAAH